MHIQRAYSEDVLHILGPGLPLLLGNPRRLTPIFLGFLSSNSTCRRIEHRVGGTDAHSVRALAYSSILSSTGCKCLPATFSGEVVEGNTISLRHYSVLDLEDQKIGNYAGTHVVAALLQYPGTREEYLNCSIRRFFTAASTLKYRRIPHMHPRSRFQPPVRGVVPRRTTSHDNVEWGFGGHERARTIGPSARLQHGSSTSSLQQGFKPQNKSHVELWM